MKTWQTIALGVLIGLFLAGMIILISSRPRGAPFELAVPATESLIQVHVDGEVIHPGVYALEKNSRVADAVFAAGGLTEDGSTAQINLAAPLLDGSKVYIPKIGEIVPTEPTSGIYSDSNDADTPSAINPLNINTASLDELVLLPGIGSTRAADIIYYRQVNGNFKTKEEIMNVPGIGESTYNQIKELIIINP